MNKENYETIKAYFGVKFIQYIINYGGELSSKTKFEELELDSNQKKALVYLDDIQRKCRQSHLNRNDFGDGFKFEVKQVDPPTFNNLRQSCGGIFLQVERGDDPVFEFLSNLMIQNYAHLLIKHKFRLSPFSHSLSITIGLEIPKLLLEQDILNKLLHRKDNLNYIFQFKLSNGTQIYHHINSFFETVMWRAFQNSCNQMDYTIENCLNELKLLLKNFRELAEGKQTNFLYFIGLSWIHLEKSIAMEDGVLHPLDSIDNPGLHTSLIASHENNKLLGAIACIKIPIKVTGPGQEGVSRTVYPDKNISKLIKKINLSLFFSLHKTNGTIVTFVENGFVLERPGSYGSNSSTFRSFNILEKNDFNTFSDWLKKIDDPIYEKFQIAFERLYLILSERRDPIDSIIDGVIAWESLFGVSGETSFKICGSILKLLNPEDKQEFYKKLKKAYDIRSKIVHGGESNLFGNSSEAEKIKKFVCNVARDCLVKLIDERKDLISLKPSERYKKILLDI